jgi:hypothetical protein
MNNKHHTYRVTSAPEDDEHLGLCAEFPSLSWLAKTPKAALKGIGKVVADVAVDMQANGEPVPSPWPKSITAVSSGCAYRRNFTATWP